MKAFIFLYQWLIALPIMLVLTILTAVTTIVGSLLGSKHWAPYYPAHLWSQCFCYIMFVRVTVEGKENIDANTSYVFVANHQGAYDIFTIYGFLGHQFRWMMKKSLERIPFVGLACKKAGHIMVDRSSPSAVKRTMEIAERQLKDGMSLVVFPEGARSWNGKMRSFKKGAFKLATEFRLPIVPLTIDGSFNVLPRTTYCITPGHIKLIIHKPIPVGIDGHNLDMVMQESFESIQSGLPENLRSECK